jgi:hypothetical protein
MPREEEPEAWMYAPDIIDLQELKLEAYLWATDRKAKGLEEMSEQQMSQLMQRIDREIQTDPELAQEVTERTRALIGFKLNRAGARGWELMHFGADAQTPFIMLVFKKRGTGLQGRDEYETTMARIGAMEAQIKSLEKELEEGESEGEAEEK